MIDSEIVLLTFRSRLGKVNYYVVGGANSGTDITKVNTSACEVVTASEPGSRGLYDLQLCQSKQYNGR
jgi:hypothetical protein